MRKRRLKRLVAVLLTAAVVFNSNSVYYAADEKDKVAESETTKDETTGTEIVESETTEAETTEGETIENETTKDETAESETIENETTKDETAESETTEDKATKDETTEDATLKVENTDENEIAQTEALKEMYTTTQTTQEKELLNASYDLYIDRTEYTIYLGQKKHIYSLYAFSYSGNDISWSSTNESVVKVDKNGDLTPLKSGVAFVKAKAGKSTAKCKVKVKKPKLEIYNDEINIYSGSNKTLYVYTDPYETNLKWKSSNTNVAVVDENGVVTGKNPGTAKVVASAGGSRVSVKVKVYKNEYELDKTSVTVVKGRTQKIKLLNATDNDSVTFATEGASDIISIASLGNGECKITGLKSGKENIYVTMTKFVDGKTITWCQVCSVNVIYKGINKQQISMAKGCNEQLKLVRVDKESPIKKVLWKTSSPKVAGVDSSTGLVKAKSSGMVKITAVVTLKNGKVERYTTNIKVSSPQIESTKVVVSSGREKDISVNGLNKWSSVSYKSSNTSVATVDSKGIVRTLNRGNTIIKIKADGKTLKCHVKVSAPELTDRNVILAPGWTSNVPLKGTNKDSNVSYSSDNSTIASVSSTGEITAGAYGTTYITVYADGETFRYLVEVTPERAINACNTGSWILANWTYSQELRMSDGYYDCSSLVFKSYGCDAALIGGTSTWGPTAANMAKYMNDTGRVLSYSYISFENLRPGDLIFHGGADNGRYLGIYHVDLYYGGGGYPGHDIVMIARPINE